MENSGAHLGTIDVHQHLLGEPLVEALPDAQLVVLRGVDHFRTPSEFDCIDAALEFVEAVPPPA